MKKRVLALACMIVLAFGCVAMATGCSAGKPVAATVEKENIYEEDVTKEIQAFRENQGLTDDNTWAQWMALYGYTPETVREAIIDSLIESKVVKAAAEANGVKADKAEVDTYYNSIKANYGSDAEFEKALKDAGLSPETYRERIEESLLEQALMDKVTPLDSQDSETMLSYAGMYASMFNGSKRSSHILFAASDEAKAEEVLAKLNSGEITFEDAAAQYSQDAGSAAKGGDVGWNTGGFVAEYTNGLDALQPGEISGLVKSEYGFHIIKCTEAFTAPEQLTSLDQLPESLRELIVQNVSPYIQQEAFGAWLQEFKGTLKIDIKDMPKDVPYNVDMSAYANATAGNGVTVVNPDQAAGGDATENTGNTENAAKE